MFASDDYLNIRVRLIWKTKDAHRVVVQADLDVVQGKPASGYGGQEKRNRVFDARPRVGLLPECLGQTVRHGTIRRDRAGIGKDALLDACFEKLTGASVVKKPCHAVRNLMSGARNNGASWDPVSR